MRLSLTATLPFTLLLVLPLALSQSPDSAYLSCGAPLRDLVHYCGHPQRAPVDRCCAAIRTFNDAFCFCQPPSFQPATQFAANSYGFSARMDVCNVTTPHARPVPSKSFDGGPDTCPYPADFSPAGDETLGEIDFDGQQCPNTAVLRKKRQSTLDAFDRLVLGKGPEAVRDFQKTVERLFVERAGLTSVGLTALQGRNLVEQFFLARMVGKFDWAAKRRNSQIWPTPGHASYVAEIGEATQRFTFVTFEPCSEKILDLYVVERNVMWALGSQFYYPETSEDALVEYDVTPVKFCNTVSEACGDFSPYTSKKTCLNFAQGLKDRKRVLCNKVDNDKVSMIALLGDTLACRYHYVLMARTNSTEFCPLVGEEALEFCQERLCPASYYGDMFADSGEPRYEYSSGFSCSRETEKCVELWPEDDTSRDAPE